MLQSEKYLKTTCQFNQKQQDFVFKTLSNILVLGTIYDIWGYVYILKHIFFTQDWAISSIHTSA